MSVGFLCWAGQSTRQLRVLNSRGLLAMCLAVAVTTAAAPVQAGAWRHDFLVPLTVEYDSNPTFEPEHNLELSRAVVAPSYTALWMDGRNVIEAELALRIERSTRPDVSPDRESPKLAVLWGRAMPRGEFNLAGSYEESATRSLELVDLDLIGVEDTRRRTTVAAEWSHAVTERASLQLQGSGLTTHYDQPRLLDYWQFESGATLSYLLDERLSTFATLTTTYYEPYQQSDAHSELVGALLGVRRQASEQLAWTLQSGATATLGEDDVSTWQGQAILEYRGERGTGGFEIGRDVATRATGGFSVYDEALLSLGYAVDERTDLATTLRWRRSNDTLDTDRVAELSVVLSRRLSPSWRGGLTYRYRHLTAGGAESAIGNMMALTFTYNHSGF